VEFLKAKEAVMAAQEQSNVPVVFSFGAHSVRTIEQDGEVWFVAADVCQVLDVANPTQAIRRLDDDERAMLNIGNSVAINDGIHAGAGNPNVNIINESGLYSLILSSRKPEARAFKRWVTHEVLPAIRKTGRYESPEQPGALNRIDPRELLLSAGSTPTLKVTTKVASAIEKKAWDLAREAYELSREHLQRRIAATAERGHPRAFDERRAMQVIKEGDLGDALAHAYHFKIGCIESYVEAALWTAQNLAAELRTAKERLHSPQDKPEDQL
jgi:prophage antirepressor-like protein